VASSEQAASNGNFPGWNLKFLIRSGWLNMWRIQVFHI
jgi:hypothetical protein